MKKLFLLICLVAFTFATQAQDVKIGYTSAALILPHVPEYTKAQDSLQAYEKVLTDQLIEKQKDLETKAKKLETDAQSPDIPKVTLQSRYRDLQRMEQELIQDRELYSKDLQQKQAQTIQPILKKVKKAIEDVGKENGYTFILSSQDGLGQDTFLYSTDKIDVTLLVLKKLGINMTPEQLKAARDKMEKEAQAAQANN